MELLNLTKQAILAPAGLQEHHIEKIFNQLLSSPVDIADIYFQSSHSESWVLESGIIKEGSHSIEQGAGVRVVSGEKTGFAYSDRLELPVLLEAANNVKAIVRQGQNAQVNLMSKNATPLAHYYAPLNPLKSLSDDQKIALLKKVDSETRQIDSRIEEVIVSLSGVYEHVLIANQDGSLAADVRPLVRMNVSVIVVDNGKREQGSMGGGGRCDYSCFIDEDTALGYGREAVRIALVNLDAGEAPAGNMPVVLGSGWRTRFRR
ncbi:MAG: TldD protein [Methylococcaceae bacterium NSP1-2]|nr:MAG: TldD protein [Methylococcaceae bacterium NSP1-2]